MQNEPDMTLQRPFPTGRPQKRALRRKEPRVSGQVCAMDGQTRQGPYAAAGQPTIGYVWHSALGATHFRDEHAYANRERS
jgi:hypothetical protein